MLTKERFKKAADIIDAKGFKTSENDDDDTQWAQAFVFDEGLFFLGTQGMADIKEALMKEYEGK